MRCTRGLARPLPRAQEPAQTEGLTLRRLPLVQGQLRGVELDRVGELSGQDAAFLGVTSTRTLNDPKVGDTDVWSFSRLSIMPFVAGES